MGHCTQDGNKLKRQYHAFTRGFIINELVRRIHPDGKTIGQILRDEIKIDGIHLGENVNSVYPVKKMTEKYVMKQCLTPKWAGKKLDMTLPGSVLPTLFISWKIIEFCEVVKIAQKVKSWNTGNFCLDLEHCEKHTIQSFKFEFYQNSYF